MVPHAISLCIGARLTRLYSQKHCGYDQRGGRMSSNTSSYDRRGRSPRPHGRRLLAAVCLAAMLTCVPVASGGQSGAEPGQLWQQFPLEEQTPPPRQPPQPSPTTTPAPSTNPAPTTTPAPAPEPTPATTVDRASASEAGDSSGGWPIAAKAAIALSGVGLAGFLLLALTSLLGRRSATRRQARPAAALRPTQEAPAAPPSAEPPVEPGPLAELLMAAQTTAEVIHAEATEDAERIRAQARGEVEALAQQRPEAVAARVAELREEAGRLRSEADAARARAKEAVDAHVEQHRRSVQERAARLQREADAEAERLRTRAEEHARALEAAGAELRASVREQAAAVELLERMLGSLDRIDLSPPAEAPPKKQPDQADLGDRVRQWTQPSDT